MTKEKVQGIVKLEIYYYIIMQILDFELEVKKKNILAKVHYHKI